MVGPGGWPMNPTVGDWVSNEMSHAMRHWRQQFRGKARFKMDHEITAKDIEEQPEMSSDEIIKGEIEYSQWQDRDDMWWASRTYDRQNTLTDQFKS